MQRLVSVALLLGILSGPVLAQQTVINVKKSESCGCCIAWIDRLKNAGFRVKSQNLALGQLMGFKLKSGINPKYASCHTAKAGGYVIEGHVPVREIKRLLNERPEAIGLAVPGMPMGSPGMDFGKQREAYEVLLIKKDGSTSVFASYPAAK